MAEDPGDSINRYSRAIAGTWPNSQFAGLTTYKVLLACELATGSQLNRHTIQDGSLVMVRYVILLPPSHRNPTRAAVEEAFKSVFSQLHKYQWQVKEIKPELQVSCHVTRY
jgi:hypothetical protein